jgi:hypothetical protein
MVVGTQGGDSFEDVERLDLSNFILFRQWERPSASGRRASLVAIAAMALLLLIVVIGVWVVSEHANWTLAVSAIALMAIGWVVLYRRSLRFNSLIVAKEFVVWETQCQQTWTHLQRSFRFRDLDLPFKLKDSPLVVPVSEITNWSIQEEERADGTATLTVRIILWRGTVALRTFFVASRDRAVSLEKAIRTGIERMNP